MVDVHILSVAEEEADALDNDMFGTGSITERMEHIAKEARRLACHPRDRKEEEIVEPKKKPKTEMTQLERIIALSEEAEADSDDDDADAEAQDDQAAVDSDDYSRQAVGETPTKSPAADIMNASVFNKRLSFGLRDGNRNFGPQDVEKLERDFLEDPVRLELEQQFLHCLGTSSEDTNMLALLGSDKESLVIENYQRVLMYFMQKHSLAERKHAIADAKKAKEEANKETEDDEKSSLDSSDDDELEEVPSKAALATQQPRRFGQSEGYLGPRRRHSLMKTDVSSGSKSLKGPVSSPKGSGVGRSHRRGSAGGGVKTATAPTTPRRGSTQASPVSTKGAISPKTSPKNKKTGSTGSNVAKLPPLASARRE